MNVRCCSRLTLLLILPGILLAGWGLLCYFAQAPETAIETASTEIEVADGPVGQKNEVALRLLNRSRRNLRVLGLVEC